VRYMVYIRGFLYLDYSFDVIILQIYNLGLYNWFCHDSLYLLPPYRFLHACAHSTILIHIYDSNLSIHLCLSILTTWNSPHHLLGSSDSPGSESPDSRAWS